MLYVQQHENELITQLKTSTDLIKDSLKDEIKQSEENIKKEMIDVKQEVTSNKNEIEDLKNRMHNIEQKVHNEVTTFAEAAKKPPTIVAEKEETQDDTKF